MRKICVFTMTVIAATLIAACGGAVENKPAANTNVANANTSKPAAAAPSKEALVVLEKKAFEAWKNKDGKFFDGFLTDSFVMFGPKGRMGKADVVKMISENKCTVGEYSMSDERMTTAGPDVAIITMKVTADVTCDGKKDPSPVISSSVYVRSGDTWKGAYHNEVPVIEQKAAATKPEAPAAKTNPANEKTETAEKGDKAEKKESAGKTETANKTATADAKPAADTAGDPLVVIEKAGWEAWKARDAKKLDELTSKDFLGVDMMGTVLATKADAIKAWTEPKCDIKNVDVSDGQSVSLGKDASLLTFKGTASGMCEGQKLGALWGTSVFVKEGDAWKLVFMFETPA